MDLTEQKQSGQNSITIFDSLNASIMSIKICPQEGVIAPENNQLIISVGDKNAGLMSSDGIIRDYVYDISKPLCYGEADYGEFHQEAIVVNNEIKMRAYIKWSNSSGITEEELEPIDILLFDGYNVINTNYENVDIDLIYPKNNDFNKTFLNTSVYNTHKELNHSLSLDDLYFKDAFTKTSNELNLKIDNLNVNCITSSNDKFSLDSEGNLTVNSITTNNSSGSVSGMTQNQVFNFIYPIGSIYMSVNNVNPTTLFGGTWEQLKDRFLLGSGDSYTNASVGGNETNTHNHYTLQSNDGTALYVSTYANAPRSRVNSRTRAVAANCNNITSLTREDSTYDETINIMPPYLTVNIWKRVA